MSNFCNLWSNQHAVSCTSPHPIVISDQAKRDICFGISLCVVRRRPFTSEKFICKWEINRPVLVWAEFITRAAIEALHSCQCPTAYLYEDLWWLRDSLKPVIMFSKIISVADIWNATPGLSPRQCTDVAVLHWTAWHHRHVWWSQHDCALHMHHTSDSTFIALSLEGGPPGKAGFPTWLHL